MPHSSNNKDDIFTETLALFVAKLLHKRYKRTSANDGAVLLSDYKPTSADDEATARICNVYSGTSGRGLLLLFALSAVAIYAWLWRRNGDSAYLLVGIVISFCCIGLFAIAVQRQRRIKHDLQQLLFTIFRNEDDH